MRLIKWSNRFWVSTCGVINRGRYRIFWRGGGGGRKKTLETSLLFLFEGRWKTYTYTAWIFGAPPPEKEIEKKIQNPLLLFFTVSSSSSLILKAKQDPPLVCDFLMSAGRTISPKFLSNLATRCEVGSKAGVRAGLLPLHTLFPLIKLPYL